MQYGWRRKPAGAALIENLAGGNQCSRQPYESWPVENGVPASAGNLFTLHQWRNIFMQSASA